MPAAPSPKAIRLLAEGRVVPAGAAAVFRVTGFSGDYVAVICDDGTAFCSCPARGECSHLTAARLIQDALVDGVAATVAKVATTT